MILVVFCQSARSLSRKWSIVALLTRSSTCNTALQPIIHQTNILLLVLVPLNWPPWTLRHCTITELGVSTTYGQNKVVRTRIGRRNRRRRDVSKEVSPDRRYREREYGAREAQHAGPQDDGVFVRLSLLRRRHRVIRRSCVLLMGDQRDLLSANDARKDEALTR